MSASDTGQPLRLADADAVFAALAAAHHGLEPADSAALNARLVLLLANALGDDAAVLNAIAAATRQR